MYDFNDDSLVGVLPDKLKETGMLDQTVVFVLSDHGGFDKSHGGTHPDEMIVFFNLRERGKKRLRYETPGFYLRSGPNGSWLFGFKLNEWVTGRPLINAFSR